MVETVEFRVFKCACHTVRVREDAFESTPGAATQPPKCPKHGIMVRQPNEVLPATELRAPKEVTGKKLGEMLEYAKTSRLRNSA